MNRANPYSNATITGAPMPSMLAADPNDVMSQGRE